MHASMEIRRRCHRARWLQVADRVRVVGRVCRKAERVKLTDFPTAVRYMEFTQAVAQSCATGQVVALPLLAC